MATSAQFERRLNSKREKEGMARAKAQGKRVSRPTLSKAMQQKIKTLYDQNRSVKSIHKELGIAYGSAWNYVQKLKAG